MDLISKRGFYTVATLDRLDDLRRMVTSLRRYNPAPIQVMIARDWLDAHYLKSAAGLLSPFETTVMLDTDMYITGKLCALFAYADEGKLSIYHEKKGSCWNSGIMSFNRELGIRLSTEWIQRRKAKVGDYQGTMNRRLYFMCDQDSLNEIISKYPIQPLPATYNYIITERTLEDEAKDWGAVKVHHFLHRDCPRREQSRAYKEWSRL